MTALQRSETIVMMARELFRLDCAGWATREGERVATKAYATAIDLVGSDKVVANEAQVES